MRTEELPDHFQRYPVMQPRIGAGYAGPKYKRLLVVGESHYLPKSSTVHLDVDAWYESTESVLNDTELEWISTAALITESMQTDFRTPAHRIYREIAWVLNEVGPRREEHSDKVKAINEIAFYNCFLRPAKEGDSLEVKQRDIDVAQKVLNWFVSAHEPEMVIIASRLASEAVENLMNSTDIPWVYTSHPGCRWWYVSEKKYGTRNGYQVFKDFLIDQQWVARNR